MKIPNKDGLKEIYDLKGRNMTWNANKTWKN